MNSWTDEAQRLTDDVLLPDANDVDAKGTIPGAHFDRLAAAGFYGLTIADDIDFGTIAEVAETLMSGCLATAFVWAQHHTVMRRILASSNVELRERYGPQLRAGSLRAGVTYAGAMSDTMLIAHKTDAGYRLEGAAPFMTGWGMVDLIGVFARSAESDQELISVLIPATDTATLRARPLPLIAADASRTVSLTFDGVDVPSDMVDGIVTLERFASTAMFGIWLNGSLALGIARRCTAELSDLGIDVGPLREEKAAIRRDLDSGLAGTTDVYAARARASQFALNTAAALVAATGSGALLRGATAERLLREATFTLVFGTRPPIRAALLERLSTSGESH